MLKNGWCLVKIEMTKIIFLGYDKKHFTGHWIHFFAYQSLTAAAEPKKGRVDKILRN